MGDFMMTPSDRQHLMSKIADAVGAAEREFQLTFCGASYTEAYEANWAVYAQTYKMLLADERPAVHLPARYVRKPR